MNFKGIKTVETNCKNYNTVIYDLIEQGGYLCSKIQQQKLAEVLKRTSSLNAVLYGIGAVTTDERKFLICTEKINADTSIPIVQINCNSERSCKMELNSQSIEQIVKQVMAELGNGSASATKTSGGAVPKTSKAAVLTKLENYDIKEFPIPEIGDDDILVKVEGCGVCGTDAHEFKRDPFGLIPVVLGHEGTG